MIHNLIIGCPNIQTFQKTCCCLPVGLLPMQPKYWRKSKQAHAGFIHKQSGFRNWPPTFSSLTGVPRYTKIIVITPKEHDKVVDSEQLATHN